MSSIAHLVGGKATILSHFPNDQEWLKMSSIDGLFGGPARRNDSRLVTIDELVKAYNQAKTSGRSAGEKAYLLGELFLATVHWLNHFMQDTRNMDARRKVAIQSLNFTVSKELAEVLNCSQGDVPARLLSMFGRTLSLHGVQQDTKDSTHYLKAAQRQQWRVFFLGGKACQFSAKQKSPALLDTAQYAQVMEDANNDAGFAESGFVLSMSDDLYVAPLLGVKGKGDLRARFLKGEAIKGRTDLENAPAFHSSFMGGWPVLCAGNITVRAGIVTEITPQSGHYMPANTDMVKVLQLLKLVGMDLSKTKIYYFDCSSFSVEDFLKANGNWQTIRENACRPVWDEYNSNPNKAAALRALVQLRFDALKLSMGKNMNDQALWQKAYQNVCWDLAVFDPAWTERANQPYPLPPSPWRPPLKGPPPPPKKL